MIMAEQTSSWLMCNPWEALQEYKHTAVMLNHFDTEIKAIHNSVKLVDRLPGVWRHVRVMLLTSVDLMSTMSKLGMWSGADISPLSSIPSRA